MDQQEEKISELLTKWNIPPEIVDNFIYNKINIEHFPTLISCPDTLKELCPVLGVRLELKDHIEVYLESIADTVTNPSTGTDHSSTLVPDSQNENISLDIINLSDFVIDTHYVTDFDLKTLLMTSPLGKSVLNYYSTYGKLDTTRRNRLTDVIGRHVYTHAVNKKLTYDEYNCIAAKIISLFPNENVGTYFVRPVSKSQSVTGKSEFAKGKLIDKVRNLLYKSGERKRGSTSTEETGPSSKIYRSADESTNEDIVWLKNNHDPWDVVIQKWIDTYNARVFCAHDNVGEFLKKWPILNDLRSEVLINLDFDRMYPGRSTVFYTKWSTFFEKLRNYKKSSMSDITGKLLDEALGTSPDTSDTDLDRKLPTQITLLGHLIPPKGRVGKKWKFSTAEAIEGLLIYVKKPGEIEDAIISQQNRALTKKQTVQPYVLVQGEALDNIQSIFIVVDKLKYSFTSTSKAFDTLFKLYHTFHCRYPAPSEHLYLLIQRSIYDIQTQHDKVIPYIMDVVNLV